MAILFWIFLDQIRPNLIKLDQIGFLSKKCYYKQLSSKLLFELRCLCGFRLSCLSEKKLLNGCTYQKMFVYKVVTFTNWIKMAILFWIRSVQNRLYLTKLVQIGSKKIRINQIDQMVQIR